MVFLDQLVRIHSFDIQGRVIGVDDINRPTGGLAGAMFFFFLNLNPHKGKTFREHVSEFDFIGLGLIIAGVVCMLIGFNNSENGWDKPDVIVLVVVGAGLVVASSINEIFTKRSPIIPPRLFKARRASPRVQRYLAANIF